MECTCSFTALLYELRCVVTQPSFQIFLSLMAGRVVSHRRRFVAELIWSSGSTHRGRHSRYHNFFSKSTWSVDNLSCVLTKLLVRVFVPNGIIELAVDDTLCRKRGLTVYGTGMHYDPLISSRAKALVRWGHDSGVLTLLLPCPFWASTKVWSLPIAFRLCRNRQGLTKGQTNTKRSRQGQKGHQARKSQKRLRDPNHRTRPEWAVELITMVAGWFPDRQLVVSGDSAYGEASVLQKLPANADLTSHVHPKGVLYEPAGIPAPGRRGPRPKKGRRLPGLKEWTNDPTLPWQTLVFDQFGLHATLQVKTRQALYYTAGTDRLLTILLVHGAKGQRPDQRFYCTRLDWTARQILSAYAARWAIEMTVEDVQQLLGFEDPANRKEKAVRRTAPMALVLYSLVMLWFHNEGHCDLQFADRPWYRRKCEPSFADLLTTLRRESRRDKIRGLPLHRRLVEKCLAPILEFLSLAG